MLWSLCWRDHELSPSIRFKMRIWLRGWQLQYVSSSPKHNGAGSCWCTHALLWILSTEVRARTSLTSSSQDEEQAVVLWVWHHGDHICYLQETQWMHRSRSECPHSTKSRSWTLPKWKKMFGWYILNQSTMVPFPNYGLMFFTNYHTTIFSKPPAPLCRHFWLPMNSPFSLCFFLSFWFPIVWRDHLGPQQHFLRGHRCAQHSQHARWLQLVGRVEEEEELQPYEQESSRQDSLQHRHWCKRAQVLCPG